MRTTTLTLLTAAGAMLASTSTAGAAPAGADDGARAVAGQVLVGYAADAGPEGREKARDAVSAVRAERIAAGVEVLHLPAGASNARAIDRLTDERAVRYAEPNWRVYAAGKPGSGSGGSNYLKDGRLWGLLGAAGTDYSTSVNGFGSHAVNAWTAGLIGSPDVYVGVIDEGIQVSHPDLDANVGRSTETAGDSVDDDGNGYVDDHYGWDFVNNDNTVYDGGRKGNADDHGTHVAGTIGAEYNGNVDTEGVVGVNHHVKLVSAKFLGRNGGTTADAIEAVDYMTDLKNRGLNLVATNNSWGGGGYSQALADAIERANAAQVLFVAAAGNGGSDGVGDDIDASPSYPASYGNENIVAVTAIDSVGAKPTWANYGLTSVDLGAPGAGIWSTTAFNGYSSYSGTSMATPHVTGAVALRAAAVSGETAAQRKSAIMTSATATPSLSDITATGGRLKIVVPAP